MESLPKKTAPLRTYSKRGHKSESEPPIKRRRVEEPEKSDHTPPAQPKAQVKPLSIRDYFKPAARLPSPPSSPTITAQSIPIPARHTESEATPPSSPPEFTTLTCEVHPKAIRRPRRRLTTKPRHSYKSKMSSSNSSGISSQDIVHNDPIDIPKRTPTNRPVGYSQALLDLGLPTVLECKECGLLYDRTVREDFDRHEAEHRAWRRRHQANASVRQALPPPSQFEVYSNVRDGVTERIIVCYYGSSLNVRELGMDALRLAVPSTNRQLQTEEEIFHLGPNPESPNDGVDVDQYKIFVFRIEERTVGVLLAKRISEGHTYYRGSATHDEHGHLPTLGGPYPSGTQEYASSENPVKARMSVDRLWVSPEHRRKGIATQLVETARTHFIPEVEITKDQVAFAFPSTDEGREFALEYSENLFEGRPMIVDIETAPLILDGGELQWQDIAPQEATPSDTSSNSLNLSL
ncbi:ESCO1/2 acetyl-transferase-domain-containing protein [Xylogone sp. PMI_703]|nr:ESCO1/2 acetyl-transferase-domain-containing protein [Xylogone sp. PMI_703]